MMPANSLSPLQAIIPDQRLRWALYIGFWIFVASFSAAHWYFLFPAEHGYTWWPLWRNKLGIWLLWGATTLLVFWLSSRFPVRKGSALRSLLPLSGLSLVVVSSFLLAWSAWIWIISGLENPATSYRYMLSYAVGMHSTFYYLAFWTTVGAEQGLRIYAEYYERIVAASAMEKRLADLQLERLRAQLQPHFLFNTLNTISSYVAHGRRDQASEMIADLALLLRESLDHGSKQTVRLDHEIEFVRKYLHLVTSRFPDQVSFELVIDPAASKAEVPSLLLQPLVENAVKHGSDDRHRKNIIVVRAERRNGQLHMAVSNPGSEAMVPDLSESGTGLRNTRDRLLHLYGDRASLTFDEGEPGSFTVVVTIPFREHGAK